MKLLSKRTRINQLIEVIKYECSIMRNHAALHTLHLLQEEVNHRDTIARMKEAIERMIKA